MSPRSESKLKPIEALTFSPEATGRRKLLRILFFHHDTEVVERCLRELRRRRYAVTRDVVATANQFVEQIQSDNYEMS